ncbi:MAG: hypothetical protein VX385_05680, partial [Acidobacteriota bacterium]|nr:hypothetical protein [Acidobacteriota bacterium]
MLQKFMFFICIMIGTILANQVINVNDGNTNFKLEQVSQEILNVNVTLGDITTSSIMTSAGEFVRLNLPNYHLSKD